MSMHLVKPWITTTKPVSRKKITDAKKRKLLADFNEHNKFLKRMKLPLKTFDEYIDYVYGKNRKKHFKPRINNLPQKIVCDSTAIPSLNTDFKELPSTCPKKAEQVYTGKKLIGIGVMHKSNLVPVFSQEDATELSKMRR